MSNTSVRYRSESRRLYVKVLAENELYPDPLLPRTAKILYFVIPRPRSELLVASYFVDRIGASSPPLHRFPFTFTAERGLPYTRVPRIEQPRFRSSIFRSTNVLPVGEREEPLSLWTKVSLVSSVRCCINFSLFCCSLSLSLSLSF